MLEFFLRMIDRLNFAVDLIGQFIIHRIPLLVSYIDVLFCGKVGISRLLVTHACFWFMKSSSLLPDILMCMHFSFFGTLYLCGFVDFKNLLFCAAEVATFSLGAERRRQRRLNRHREDGFVTAVDGISKSLTVPLLQEDYFAHFGILDVHICKFACSAGGLLNLLCLHQFGSASFTFQPVALILRENQSISQITAFDRPGHGTTSRPAEDATVTIAGESVPVYSTDCALHLTRHLSEPGPTVLLGCGAGARLAIESVTPAVKALIIISPPVEDLPRVARAAATSRVGRAISSSILRAELGDLIVKRAWHKSKTVPDELLERYRRVTRLPGWSDAMAAVIKRHKSGDLEISSLNTLPDKFPVLVIYGREDRDLNESDIQRFTEVLRKAGGVVTVVCINACGSVPHEEQPAQVARHINTFLSTQLYSIV